MTPTTIVAAQESLRRGACSSRELVEHFLERIARSDDVLAATMSVDESALDRADRLDRERRRHGARGPLHGIPLAVKDNIQVLGMPITGGTVALRDLRTTWEAPVVTTLRRAGAIIIAKTSMTELANWMSSSMPDGYNAVRGFSRNPYDARLSHYAHDERPVLSPGGSSSGIGTAAGLWMANIGTETCGSILSPSIACMLVGVKPTVGRISTRGVMPIAAEQDVVGPMAVSVADAGILLDAMRGGEHGSHDPRGDLVRHGLAGVRLGVPRAYFREPVVTGWDGVSHGGLSEGRERLLTEVIDEIRRAGAELVEDVDMPSILAALPGESFLGFPVCSTSRRRADGACSTVMSYGMKRDFDRWLRRAGASTPVRDLRELRLFNDRNARQLGTLRFGQDVLDLCDSHDLEADRARHAADRRRDLALCRTWGIDAAMSRGRLDALLFPGATGAAIAARAGYPSVTVPCGFVSDPPSGPRPGSGSSQAPYGVTVTGRAHSEPLLLAIAREIETVIRGRVPPPDPDHHQTSRACGG